MQTTNNQLFKKFEGQLSSDQCKQADLAGPLSKLVRCSTHTRVRYLSYNMQRNSFRKYEKWHFNNTNTEIAVKHICALVSVTSPRLRGFTLGYCSYA